MYKRGLNETQKVSTNIPRLAFYGNRHSGWVDMVQEWIQYLIVSNFLSKGWKHCMASIMVLIVYLRNWNGHQPTKPVKKLLIAEGTLEKWDGTEEGFRVEHNTESKATHSTKKADEETLNNKYSAISTANTSNLIDSNCTSICREEKVGGATHSHLSVHAALAKFVGLPVFSNQQASVHFANCHLLKCELWIQEA